MCIAHYKSQKGEIPVSVPVYALLGVREGDAHSLHREYTKTDQAAFKMVWRGDVANWSFWNPDNPEFIYRQVVEAILELDKESLSDEEKKWFREILWFWNHHCISWATSMGRKTRAQAYALEALNLQSEDHSNRITRLLFLLVHDRLEEAKTHAKTVCGVERKTALDLIAGYESALWPLAKEQLPV